jgi:hypothetical protein
MTITKKHLKELADIVLVAQTQAPVEDVAELIKSFAKRHAPNFSESHWDDYMHKQKKADNER